MSQLRRQDQHMQSRWVQQDFMEEFMRKQLGCIICMGSLLGLCSSQPQYCRLDSLHEYCQAVASHYFIFLLSLVHLTQTCGFEKDKPYKLRQTVVLFFSFLQIFIFTLQAVPVSRKLSRKDFLTSKKKLKNCSRAFPKR